MVLIINEIAVLTLILSVIVFKYGCNSVHCKKKNPTRLVIDPPYPFHKNTLQ